MFPERLRLEVIALLCLKAAALMVIYYWFVAPAEKPQLDSRAVLAHLFKSGN